MTEFTSTSVLEVTVSDSSLRSARDQIQSELGGVSVDIQASGGGVSRGRRGGGSLISDGAGVGMLDVMMDQLEVLEGIDDTLEKIGQGGGFGGGSGGGSNGGGGGIIDTITTGLAARALPSLGVGGTLAGLASSGTAAAAGTVTAGAGLGLAGTRALQETGVTQGFRGAGRDVQSALGSDGTQLASGLIGTLAGAGTVTTAGGAALGLAQGDPGRAVSDANQASSTATLGPEDISALQSALEEPKWLSTLAAGPSKPQWLATLASPSIAEPMWLTTLENPPLPEPGWIPQLDTTISVETPAWADAIADGVSATLDLSVASPQLDLRTGSVRSEIESALDSFTSEVVDEAVQEVKDAFDLGGLA